MHSSEFTIYKFIVLIVSLIAIIFGIVNLIQFNNVRLNNNCTEINKGTATTMVYLNLVLIILSSVLLIWSLYRMFITGKSPKPLIKENYNEFHYNHTVDSINEVKNEVNPQVNPQMNPQMNPGVNL